MLVGWAAVSEHLKTCQVCRKPANGNGKSRKHKDSVRRTKKLKEKANAV